MVSFVKVDCRSLLPRGQLIEGPDQRNNQCAESEQSMIVVDIKLCCDFKNGSKN